MVTAQDAVKGRNLRKMVRSPQSFDGTLERLVEEFVIPNLPSAGAVTQIHKLLVEYSRTDNPLFLLRTMRGTKRGQIYLTEHGNRFKATDNAPAWWTHYALFHQIQLATGDFSHIVATIPTHMFEVVKQIPQNISAAGWHVAHLASVKDGRTNFTAWSREELVTRFLRNVHPCNYFFIPKPDWQHFGGDKTIISFFASLYSDRYRDVWDEFRQLAGVDVDRFTGTPNSILYRYGSAETSAGASEGAFNSAAEIEHRRHADNASVPIASYSASRLLFKADVIDPLSDGECFRIVTPAGTYEMSKADFVREFPGIIQSKSYRESRVYHYRKPPKRAAKFLVQT